MDELQKFRITGVECDALRRYGSSPFACISPDPEDYFISAFQYSLFTLLRQKLSSVRRANSFIKLTTARTS